MSTVPDNRSDVQSDANGSSPFVALFAPEDDAGEEATLEALLALDSQEIDGVAVTLDEWLSEQIGYYRALGTNGGQFLAAELAQLVDIARFLHAATPEDFTARREIQDATVREDLVHCGYVRGLADAGYDQSDLF